jgi:hypothetical protein
VPTVDPTASIGAKQAPALPPPLNVSPYPGPAGSLGAQN